MLNLLHLYLIYVNGTRQHLREFSVITAPRSSVPREHVVQLENGWRFISGAMRPGQKSLPGFYCKTIQRTKRRRSKKTQVERDGGKEQRRRRTSRVSRVCSNALDPPLSVSRPSLVPFFFSRELARYVICMPDGRNQLNENARQA